MSGSKRSHQILFVVLCLFLSVVAGAAVPVGKRIYSEHRRSSKRSLTEGLASVNDKNIESGEEADSETGSLREDTSSKTKVLDYSYVEPDFIEVTTADYSDIAGAVLPAIVSVDCEYVRLMYDFFGNTSTEKAMGSGTGFIIASDCKYIYMATNNHVVADSDSITVTFCDGTSSAAEIVGTDKNYDLAVICTRVESLDDTVLSHIRRVVFGDSDDVFVGQSVMAVGNALGFGVSVTHGFISALDRDVTVDDITQSLIQTDSAINPGNSGGPLIDDYGRVIGINSVKYASEEVEGVGYAIPISYAMPVINDLISYVELSNDEQGYLGIEGKNVSQTYANAFGMPQGVYIYSIDPDSPAAGTDLRTGDIITAVNGRRITTVEEFQNRLEHIRAGKTVTLTVCTNLGGIYIERNVSVTLGVNLGSDSDR